jgi:two-component system NarL family sensor kinase
MKFIATILWVCCVIPLMGQSTIAERAAWASDKAWELKDNDPDSSFYFANQALILAQQCNDLEIVAHSFADIGNYYKTKEDYSNALSFYNKSLKVRYKRGDKASIASGYNQIGLLYKQKEVYDSAAYFFNKGIQLLGPNYGSDIKLKLLDGLAWSMFHVGHHEEAIMYLDSSFALAEMIGDSVVVAKSIQNKGVIHQYLGHNSLADKYYKEAERYYQKLNNKKGLIDVQINQATLFLLNGEVEEAEKRLLGAEALSSQIGFNDNLTSIYLDLGELYANLDPKKAKNYFEKAYYHAQLNNKTAAIIESGIGLGGAELIQGNFAHTLVILNAIEQYVEKEKTSDRKINYYELKSLYYTKVGDFKNALLVKNKAQEIKDSLNLKMLKVQDLSVMLEVSRQEQKATTEKLRREKLEKESAVLQANYNQVIILVLAILVLLLLWMVGSIRRSAKQKERQAAIELEKKRQEQHFENEINRLTFESELKFFEESLKLEEEIREKIGRDLHDQLASKLAVIQISLDSFVETLESEDLSNQLSQVISLVNESCNDVRDIGRDLIGQERLKESLNYSLDKQSQTINNSGKLSVKFDAIGEPYAVQSEIKKNILATIALLIDNIIRHAKAKNVSLQLFYHHDSINISLDDDGIGFEEAGITDGVGLRNAKTRIQQINGTIEINSRINFGTSISIIIPIEND